MQKNNCRVCGFELLEPPWGMDGKTPSWDICRCCGTEFGYEDCTLKSIKKNRQEWISSGCPWFDKKQKPEFWSWENQKRGIPPEYI